MSIGFVEFVVFVEFVAFVLIYRFGVYRNVTEINLIVF